MISFTYMECLLHLSGNKNYQGHVVVTRHGTVEIVSPLSSELYSYLLFLLVHKWLNSCPILAVCRR